MRAEAIQRRGGQAERTRLRENFVKGHLMQLQIGESNCNSSGTSMTRENLNDIKEIDQLYLHSRGP